MRVYECMSVNNAFRYSKNRWRSTAFTCLKKKSMDAHTTFEYSLIKWSSLYCSKYRRQCTEHPQIQAGNDKKLLTKSYAWCGKMPVNAPSSWCHIERWRVVQCGAVRCSAARCVFTRAFSRHGKKCCFFLSFLLLCLTLRIFLTWAGLWWDCLMQPFMYYFTFAWGLFLRSSGLTFLIFLLLCSVAYISTPREKKRTRVRGRWVFPFSFFRFFSLHLSYFADIFSSKIVKRISEQC